MLPVDLTGRKDPDPHSFFILDPVPGQDLEKYLTSVIIITLKTIVK